MSVLGLLSAVTIFVWFGWLIWYSSKKSKHQTDKLDPSIVKFPSTRVPSRIKKSPYFKPDNSFSSSGFENRQAAICQHERALRGACFGDFAKATSLIEYELRRTKVSMTRSQAADSALQRLRSDRR